MAGQKTSSGVWVTDDYRNNLIIDRYDPVFVTMRGSKIERLRSENSEDVLTWNVFRSLRQIDPPFWFTRLFARTFGYQIEPCPRWVNVNLWFKVSPPPALRSCQKDEGDSEIDIALETEAAVWFIEAKYKSDVSERTTNDPERDQILRNIDVGSWYADTRHFYFALLVLDEKHSPTGLALVKRYMNSREQVLLRLAHRTDGLSNLKDIGWLKWNDLAAVLSDCRQLAPREDERYFAKRALEWLSTKGITETLN
jgi:hypothetical protein